jgi:hypothetical protein
LTIPIQFTVSRDSGEKQSKGLCFVGDFGNVVVSVAVFIKLAYKFSPGDGFALDILGGGRRPPGASCESGP